MLNFPKVSLREPWASWGFNPIANKTWLAARSFEEQKGRVAVLSPGESRTFELSMEVHPDAASLRAAEAAVAKLQQGVTPEVLRQPASEWSPT